MFVFFGATFDRKAGWDCVRPEKSHPDPSLLSQTLSVIQLLAVKDLGQNCTKRGFFNIEDNKCNANEASHTSLLYLLDVY